jgi:hypothetical protein
MPLGFSQRPWRPSRRVGGRGRLRSQSSHLSDVTQKGPRTAPGTYGAPAKRPPTFSQTTAVASNNKSATYRHIALMAAIPTDLTDALFPGSRARTLHVVVCLMGSFLTIAPRGGPIENFRQETHLERLASIDDRPRGHRMFARDNADRSLKFVEKSVVRLLIVSRHHWCARDSPSLWGRYPAGLPPPSTR